MQHLLHIGFLQTHTDIESKHVEQIRAVGKKYGKQITVSVYKNTDDILKDAEKTYKIRSDLKRAVKSV